MAVLKETTPRRYLLQCGLAFLAMLAACAAFAVLVDPYYVFGTPRVAGWNDIKPAASNRGFDAKLAQLARSAPRTLILGNSRAESGLDPESAAWPEDYRPVFNGALAGTTAATALALLRAAEQRGVRPEKLIVGVEFFDFVASDPDSGAPERDTSRNALPVWRQDMRAAFHATLSIRAMSDSVRTLLSQGQAYAPTLTPAGFNPLQEYLQYARRAGFRSLFERKYADYDRMLASRVPRSFADPDTVGSFRSLRFILRDAASANIRTTLFIYPYHSSILDLIVRRGFQPSFEDWKKALQRVVAEEGGSARIIDFSQRHPLIAEAIPPPGDLREMQYYWEGGHFRPALGDRIIAALTDQQGDFGVELAAHHTARN